MQYRGIFEPITAAQTGPTNDRDRNDSTKEQMLDEKDSCDNQHNKQMRSMPLRTFIIRRQWTRSAGNTSLDELEIPHILRLFPHQSKPLQSRQWRSVPV
jgi:hypothetical protein